MFWEIADELYALSREVLIKKSARPRNQKRTKT